MLFVLPLEIFHSWTNSTSSCKTYQTQFFLSHACFPVFPSSCADLYSAHCFFGFLILYCNLFASNSPFVPLIISKIKNFAHWLMLYGLLFFCCCFYINYITNMWRVSALSSSRCLSFFETMAIKQSCFCLIFLSLLPLNLTIKLPNAAKIKVLSH